MIGARRRGVKQEGKRCERDAERRACRYLRGLFFGRRLRVGAGALAVFRRVWQLGVPGVSGCRGAVCSVRHPAGAPDPAVRLSGNGSRVDPVGHPVDAAAHRRDRRAVPAGRGGDYDRRRGGAVTTAFSSTCLAGRGGIHVNRGVGGDGRRYRDGARLFRAGAGAGRGGALFRGRRVWEIRHGRHILPDAE